MTGHDQVPAPDGARPNPFLIPGPFSVWIPGLPAPQGSKRAIPVYRGRGADRAFTGRTALVESSAGKVDAWRADVRLAAERAWSGRDPMPGAVRLRIAFVLPRPKTTPKRRPTPPAVKRPDVSKLLRATEDALTSAGVWLDDAVVVAGCITKRIAEPDEPPGAWVDVTPCGAVPPPTPDKPHGAPCDCP